MFYKESNASKACVVKLIDKLRSCGLKWMDTQMITPTIAQMGGKNISQKEFLIRLGEAKKTAEPIGMIPEVE